MGIMTYISPLLVHPPRKLVKRMQYNSVWGLLSKRRRKRGRRRKREGDGDRKGCYTDPLLPYSDIPSYGELFLAHQVGKEAPVLGCTPSVQMLRCTEFDRHFSCSPCRSTRAPRRWDIRQPNLTLCPHHLLHSH